MDKAAFFAALPPLRREEVKLPNGSSVWVRQVTVGERDRIEIALAGKSAAGIRAHLAIATVVDEAGSPIFAEADFDRLSDLPARSLEPIFEAVQRLNAITDEDVEALAGESEASR